jgi:hypothetical protein
MERGTLWAMEPAEVMALDDEDGRMVALITATCGAATVASAPPYDDDDPGSADDPPAEPRGRPCTRPRGPTAAATREGAASVATIAAAMIPAVEGCPRSTSTLEGVVRRPLSAAPWSVTKSTPALAAARAPRPGAVRALAAAALADAEEEEEEDDDGPAETAAASARVAGVEVTRDIRLLPAVKVYLLTRSRISSSMGGSIRRCLMVRYTPARARSMNGRWNF